MNRAKSVFLTGLFVLILLVQQTTFGKNMRGKWRSQTIGTDISFKVKEPLNAERDFSGKVVTVVYLERLGFEKIGQNSNAKNVSWLRAQGYRVVELDYKHHPEAVSPQINKDIIAINDAIASGNFCGLKDCSTYQSYVLFEGYRILRNLPYFKDDPTVYNTPKEYQEGDSLRMDVVYPAHAKVKVSVVLSFSYSNSFATYDSDAQQLTNANKDQRLNLSYTLAGFDDAVLEGLPARGMAWAIADHPKYCSWGKGKPVDGKNDAYKSFQTNPDAAQKVKSAIRTLRAKGESLGLSGQIGIFGFSRGSTAGAMALDDRRVEEFEAAGQFQGVNDEVQAAVLGPGVFDYTLVYDERDDGDTNLEVRCPWVWGSLTENRRLWESMGASYLVERSAAPTLFFYNRDDEKYYQDQVRHLKDKLDALNVTTATLTDYGKGHSIPKAAEHIQMLYDFFAEHLACPVVKGE